MAKRNTNQAFSADELRVVQAEPDSTELERKQKDAQKRLNSV